MGKRDERIVADCRKSVRYKRADGVKKASSIQAFSGKTLTDMKYLMKK